MATQIKSAFKISGGFNFDTYQERTGQPFMLFQSFKNTYNALDVKHFWFGGTETDANISTTVFNSGSCFMCLTNFYITEIQCYSTQIFNVGEKFTLEFVDLTNNTTLESFEITTPTPNYSSFVADPPIQFFAGNSYVMKGTNNQVGNLFSLYQLTAVAYNGDYPAS
jgi:hypothetical protein